MSEVFNWNVSAPGNSAVSPNGFPEGMAPAGINNSSREVMASMARLYEAINGGIVSTGAGNVYNIAISQNLDGAYQIGMVFAFTADKTNSGAATLNVNGVGATSIVGLSGDDMQPGQISNGGVYTVTYTGTAFVLHLINYAKAPVSTTYEWDFNDTGLDQTVGTWVKPAGLKRLYVELTGGGGGGEGGRNSAAGGHGGSAGTAIVVYDAGVLPASVGFLIGKGGRAGTTGTGSGVNRAADGFNSDFGGGYITATAGQGAGDGTDADTKLGVLATIPIVNGTPVPHAFVIHPGNSGVNGFNGTLATAYYAGSSSYYGSAFEARFETGRGGFSFGCGGQGARPGGNGQQGGSGFLRLVEYF